jgi:hypothetical protein
VNCSVVRSLQSEAAQGIGTPSVKLSLAALHTVPVVNPSVAALHTVVVVGVPVVNPSVAALQTVVVRWCTCATFLGERRVWGHRTFRAFRARAPLPPSSLPCPPLRFRLRPPRPPCPPRPPLSRPVAPAPPPTPPAPPPAPSPARELGRGTLKTDTEAKAACAVARSAAVWLVSGCSGPRTRACACSTLCKIVTDSLNWPTWPAAFLMSNSARNTDARRLSGWSTPCAFACAAMAFRRIGSASSNLACSANERPK